MPDNLIVGTAEPLPGAPMRGAMYCGHSNRLRGQRAIIRDAASSPDNVVAQFNKRWTGLAAGWWDFPRSDFVIDGETP